MSKNNFWKIVIMKMTSIQILVFLSLFLIFTLFPPTTRTHAVPAYDGPFKVEQPSGKTFEARKHGDEWNNWIEANGHRIYKNDKTGNWEYYRYLDFKIIRLSISNTPFNLIVGETNPAHLYSPKKLAIINLPINSYTFFVLVVFLFFFAVASVVLIYRRKKNKGASNRIFFMAAVCLAFFIALIGLLFAGNFFVKDKIKKENSDKDKQEKKQAQEINDWKIYRNEKYGFEVKYPTNWQVYATDNPYGNVINIYKTGNPPFTYNNNVTQVSIFPEGLSMEGPAGESERRPTGLTLAEENRVNQFVLSNNKKPFGYFINLKNTPQNWGHGYIWGSVEIKNQTFVCRDEAKNMNTCEPLADGLNITGEVDESERNTVKGILSTFKFTR